jgi:FKBP-type peptidyl-prolyl cis-trans isomerase 2
MLGMKAGESTNFTVSPASGYGIPDPSKITNLSRYYNRSLYEQVPMGYFFARNITVANGTLFPTAEGNVMVVDYNDENATIKYLFYPGHQFVGYGLPQTVTEVTNDTMVVRFDLIENNTYTATDPTTGQKLSARVTHADNDTIVLDENPPLAGKELQFEVTLISLSR